MYSHWEKIADQQEKDFRAASLRDLISPYLDSTKNVLDLGCGTCDFTIDLLKKGYNIESVDISPEMLQIGKKILEKSNFSTEKIICSSIEELVSSRSNKYDQIICLDVLEHTEDDLYQLQQIYQLLKPGGRLFFTVPALSSLYGPKDEAVGHYRRYDRQPLLQLFWRAGFDIHKVRFWNYIGVPITWISVNILHTRVKESFRYKNDWKSKITQFILKQ